MCGTKRYESELGPFKDEAKSTCLARRWASCFVRTGTHHVSSYKGTMCTCEGEHSSGFLNQPLNAAGIIILSHVPFTNFWWSFATREFGSSKSRRKRNFQKKYSEFRTCCPKRGLHKNYSFWPTPFPRHSSSPNTCWYVITLASRVPLVSLLVKKWEFWKNVIFNFHAAVLCTRETLWGWSSKLV